MNCMLSTIQKLLSTFCIPFLCFYFYFFVCAVLFLLPTNEMIKSIFVFRGSHLKMRFSRFHAIRQFSDCAPFIFVMKLYVNHEGEHYKNDIAFEAMVMRAKRLHYNYLLFRFYCLFFFFCFFLLFC